MLMKQERQRHSCEGDLPHEGYGEAVHSCEERSDGTLWVDNGEYGSQVRYCPYCGYQAKVWPPVRDDWGTAVAAKGPWTRQHQDMRVSVALDILAQRYEAEVIVAAEADAEGHRAAAEDRAVELRLEMAQLRGTTHGQHLSHRATQRSDDGSSEGR